ncbi:MAG TPA: glycosyltransferase family 4 protein [Elusimicrobiota bacterium]|nr:glycosyltransferase family 4 protein [Elusimicrobiota bacterium]
MRQIILAGAHLGFPMDRTPLGGGGMVGLQLARAWAREGARLTVLGAGPQAPWDPPPSGARYVRLPSEDPAPDLVRLSETGYARFCRRFEAATTAHILEPGRFEPSRACVVVNDISESPDLERLAAAGFRIVSIWHVDVVAYFNRMYLGGLVAPERLTRAFTRVRRGGLGRAVPRILRLVFEKQEAAVRFSRRIVLPSRGMAEVLAACYRHVDRGIAAKAMVLPWGGWSEAFAEEELRPAAARLKERYEIGPRTRVLATLSRISPEKGLHVLVDALHVLEDRAPEIEDLRLLICGEPAFMRGAAYSRRVRAGAARLKRFRVVFPGYLAGLEKQSHLRLAELFVSPSLHESYGLTIVEALRAGLPVLASDHHGVEEILRPEYGRIVSYAGAGRAERMAGALRELLGGGELAEMGRRAKAASEGMSFEDAARALRRAAEEEE